jgi:hypothetical protein
MLIIFYICKKLGRDVGDTKISKLVELISIIYEDEHTLDGINSITDSTEEKFSKVEDSNRSSLKSCGCSSLVKTVYLACVRP